MPLTGLAAECLTHRRDGTRCSGSQQCLPPCLALPRRRSGYLLKAGKPFFTAVVACQPRDSGRSPYVGSCWAAVLASPGERIQRSAPLQQTYASGARDLRLVNSGLRSSGDLAMDRHRC